MNSDDQSQPTTIPLTKTKLLIPDTFATISWVIFSLRNIGAQMFFFSFFFGCPPPKFVPAFFGGQHFRTNPESQISLGPVSLTVGNEQMVDAWLTTQPG